MNTSYDRIGLNYADLRKPDPRIEAMISGALGGAKTVLNVGAGAGSYEPLDREVVALEPSIEMIRQRPASAAPVIQGAAEDLPFNDNSFDASMAILTVHHWADKAKGLKEMRRVTRNQIVIVTFDHSHQRFWLTDYLPELVTVDEGKMPEISDFGWWLGPLEATPLPIPHDCTDGMLGAYWRRPAAYLDPRVRDAISCFWMMGDVSEGLENLRSDIASGAWANRYSDLLGRDELDLGYRLVTAKAKGY